MKQRVFLPLMFAAALILPGSCKKELIPGTYEGKPVSMGNGEAWSWVTFDKAGKPVAIGISLSDAAMENLPDSVNHPDGNEHSNVFEMQLPPELATQTPFKHCGVNWNPKGHIPNGIYNKPHFDFHFYTITSDVRNAIPDYMVDSSKHKNFPAADYLPADYVAAKAEPKMGMHWVDLKSGELQPPPNNQPFTETFVYGTYEGKVIFYEPMLTYSFLKNITEFTRSIPWPAKVMESGYYPKKMRVNHKDGVYTVSIEDFEYRKAS